MDQKLYNDLAQTLDVKKALEELKSCVKLQTRLLAIRVKGVLWEIENPHGRNLYVVRTNFQSGVSALNVTPPKAIEIEKDYNYMKQSASKSINDPIPDNTCLIFATMGDINKYAEKACGEVYRDYENSNFIC